jgi:hypothetical protein
MAKRSLLTIFQRFWF